MAEAREESWSAMCGERGNGKSCFGRCYRNKCLGGSSSEGRRGSWFVGHQLMRVLVYLTCTGDYNHWPQLFYYVVHSTLTTRLAGRTIAYVRKKFFVITVQIDCRASI